MKVKVLTHPTFGEVRTVTLEEQKFFAARDVAIALGYKKRPDAFITKQVEKEDKQIVMLPALPLSPSSVMRNTVVVNDKGVAALCEAAFCDFAEDIKQWLLNSANSGVMTPQIFNHPQFGNLRAINIDGEPFFIGIDVARALGYANPSKAVIDHVPDKFKRIITAEQMASNQDIPETGIPFSQEAMGGVQRLVVINEAGLYKLIMRSKLPKAEEFSDWACGEVLPSIRKYGYYSVKGEEPVKKVRRAPVPELAIVYAVLLSNMLVKIGYTKDLTERLKDLQKETKADVLAWAASAVMTRDEAILLERALKVKFFAHLVSGEFFNCNFDDVKAALVATPADKLLEIAREMPNPDEKTKILLQAAAVLA